MLLCFMFWKIHI